MTTMQTESMSDITNYIKSISCKDCDEILEEDYVWLGEDKNGQGWFRVYSTCPECGKCTSKLQAE